jgi:hypothetical protein
MLKVKAVPLQAWDGPEGSRKLRVPDFLTTTQPYAPAAFNPRKYTWYSFLLETESTPRANSAIRKIFVNEKFHDTIWNFFGPFISSCTTLTVLYVSSNTTTNAH